MASGAASGRDDAGLPPERPHPLAVHVGALITVAFVVLDQATKELAERFLVPGTFVPWLGSGVGWELVYNPGGAFGVPAPSWIFLVVSVLVLVLVARALPRTASLLAASAYGLLLSGAIGNVLDRLFRPGGPDRGFGDGWVVDFVAWGGFPRFNVADSAITVGFVLLVVALLVEERRAARAVEASGAVGSDHDGEDASGGSRAAPDDAAAPDAGEGHVADPTSERRPPDEDGTP